MATSGSYTGTTTNSYITAKLDWVLNSQDQSSNTSNITFTLWYKKSSAVSVKTSGTFIGGITVDGTAYSSTSSLTLNCNNTWVKAYTKTVTVTHSSDGTKTLPVSVQGYINGSTFKSTTLSCSIALPAISRAASISVSGSTIGSNATIEITTDLESFSNTITYAFGSLSGTIVSESSDTSISWVIPEEFADQIPNATSGTAVITCNTYVDGSLMGTSSASVTVNVPNRTGYIPTLSSDDIALSVVGNVTKFGYIKGKTKVQVTPSAKGAHGSTITTYTVVVNEETLTGSASVTSSLIATAGENTATVTATDSRGRTASASVSFTVLDYTAPTLDSFTCYRSDSTGAEDNSGNYLTASGTVSMTSLNGANATTTKLSMQAEDGELTQFYSSANASEEFTVTVYADPQSNITVYINVNDEISSLTQNAIVISAFPFITVNSKGNAIGFGCYADDENPGIDYAIESRYKSHMKVGDVLYNMFYLPGDEFSPNGMYCVGAVSNGTKSIYFEIPIIKIACASSKLTLKTLEIILRVPGLSGGYPYMSNNGTYSSFGNRITLISDGVLTDGVSSIAPHVHSNSISVNVTFSETIKASASSTAITNNVPISVYICSSLFKIEED